MKPKTPAPKTESPPGTNVLIVDDHPFLRMGLADALAREPGLCVCGAVPSAEDALANMGKLRPDVVVTDLNLPGKSGLELIKDLAVLYPSLPIVVLSMHDEEIYAERCLRAGARAYVMKSEGPEKLAIAIRKVLAAGIHVSAATSARVLKAFSGRREKETETPLGQLTDRELDVFRWIGRGLSTREIAARLNISAKTIETHRMHIKAKLSIATAAELISYASRWTAAGD